MGEQALLAIPDALPAAQDALRWAQKDEGTNAVPYIPLDSHTPANAWEV